jgi:hypothetical protein
MKILVRIIQVLVGVLFIISGLVKANDPLGLGYKMQEFFELWSSSLASGHLFARNALVSFFDFLHEHSLSLAVIMITLEIMAGVALLLAWKKRLVLNLLLVLMLFFTFLTGYAHLSGKFTNCGCFGDCLPISPLTSFLKDVVLLLLVIVLIAGRRFILSPVRNRLAGMLLFVALFGSLALQWFALRYLPLADCLPFKKGNNIAEQMKPPPNAVQDSFDIKFIYEKNGKRFEFSPEGLPADLATYHFIDRKQNLIRKGNAEPRIKGFALVSLSDVDSTEAILSNPGYALFYFSDPALSGDADWQQRDELNRLWALAGSRQVPVYALTNDPVALQAEMKKLQWPFPIFKIDYTVFRTAARTNPEIYLIRQGTILEKWPLAKAEDALSYLTTLKP